MKKKFPIFWVLVFAGVFLSGIVIGMSLVSERDYMPIERRFAGEIPQLSTEGYEMVDVDVIPFVIYLSSNCYRISMTTSESQTSSIQSGMEDSIEFRPNTHDLIKFTLENFGIEVLMVKIEAMDENTYFAKLLLKQGDNILNLDSRPSDAIAIAVRADAPVYAKRDLLETYGSRFC